MKHMRKRRLTYGVGINDAPYQVVYVDEQGTTVKCPFYAKWHAMLTRAYSQASKVKQPSYADVIVHPDWHSFMNFREWMSSQDWEGKQLDKDFLIPGNKQYGPDACLFVPHALNSLLTLREAQRGDLPLGVTRLPGKREKPYVARCSFYAERKHLGCFATKEEAAAKYLEEKNAYIQQVAEQETDPRIIAALKALRIGE